MVTHRQVALTAAIFIAFLAALNVAVAFLTQNSVPRRVMRHARESGGAGVLALGNSLVASGFDEAAFNSGAGLASPGGAVNLGLGASSPVEQLLLLRYALAQGLRPNLLIYGFYDFQLTTYDRFSIADLIGNHAMLYYVEPFYARQFYALSLHDSLQFRVMHSLPLFADRGAIWAKVEIVRRALAQQGMPPQRSNRLGRVSDFSLLEAGDAKEFRQQCEASLPLTLAPAVNELLRQARDAGIGIVVVEMPMRRAHRNLFYDNVCWNQYTSHLRTLLGSYGVTFVDASHWIDDDLLFADPLHLSDHGAAQFSDRLGRLLGPKLVLSSTHLSGATSLELNSVHSGL